MRGQNQILAVCYLTINDPQDLSIFTCVFYCRMLSSVLQTVCQSLSDSNEVVRSAALFALGQFSEHLQVSQGITATKTIVNTVVFYACLQYFENMYRF